MSQEQFPGARHPARGAPASRLGRMLRPSVLIAVAVVLALIASSIAAWPFSARQASAASGSITVSPSQGPAGTQTELSGTGFPREADLQDNTRSFTFDGAPITFPHIVACSSGIGGATDFGFGLDCNGNDPYPFQIPQDALPGPHVFHILIQTNNPLVQTVTLVDATTTFTVVGNVTPTPTVTTTDTPSPTASVSPSPSPSPSATGTATASATVTNTPLPNVPTATNTGTPLPNVPTATYTNTPLPNAPTNTPTVTATVTPTPAKIKVPFVAIVRAEFNRGVVAIALHTAPAAKIHIELKLAKRSGAVVLGLTHDGVTDARGILAYDVKISFPSLKSGGATLTISETSDGSTQTVRRVYRYRVS